MSDILKIVRKAFLSTTISYAINEVLDATVGKPIRDNREMEFLNSDKFKYAVDSRINEVVCDDLELTTKEKKAEVQKKVDEKYGYNTVYNEETGRVSFIPIVNK